MATVAVPNKTKLIGGSFLIEEHSSDQVFTPEDLTEEHLQIARTTEEFARNEILPNTEKIEHKEFAVGSGPELGFARGGLGPRHLAAKDPPDEEDRQRDMERD